MVYVTPGLRWVSGAWCAMAIAIVGWSMLNEVRPAVTLLLLVACAAPMVLVGTLVGFGSEPLTAAEILHATDAPAGRR